MEKSENTQKVMEIDVNDLIWSVLSQWKMVVVVSIFVATIVTGAKYYKDTQSYNAQIETQKEEQKMAEMTIDERIESVNDRLTESDRNTVNYYIQQKKWLDDQKAYLSNSILMKMDPTNQRVLKLVYNIYSEDTSNLPTLLYDYSILIHGNKMIEAIKPFIDDDLESGYIEELFFEQKSRPTIDIIEGNGTSLWVNIALPEEADADAIVSAIDGEMVSYGSVLQQKYAHNISLADSEETHAFIKEISEKKTDIINNVISLENATKNTESLLSETQREAVNEILSLEEIRNSENDNSNEKKVSEKPAAPRISKKYALIGLIFGIFVYIAAYVALILAKGEITSSASFSRYSRSRILGEPYYEDRAVGLNKLLNSGIVDKYHYHTDFEDTSQLKRLNDSVLAISEHMNTTTATLLIAGKNRKGVEKHKDGIQELVKSIKDNAVKNGVSLNVIDMTERINEKELLSVKYAILVAERGSKISKVERIESICSEYGIRILGSVYVRAQFI